jgi:hypothetical protein
MHSATMERARQTNGRRKREITRVIPQCANRVRALEYSSLLLLQDARRLSCPLSREWGIPLILERLESN